MKFPGKETESILGRDGTMWKGTQTRSVSGITGQQDRVWYVSENGWDKPGRKRMKPAFGEWVWQVWIWSCRQWVITSFSSKEITWLNWWQVNTSSGSVWEDEGEHSFNPGASALCSEIPNHQKHENIHKHFFLTHMLFNVLFLLFSFSRSVFSEMSKCVIFWFTAFSR